MQNEHDPISGPAIESAWQTFNRERKGWLSTRSEIEMRAAFMSGAAAAIWILRATDEGNEAEPRYSVAEIDHMRESCLMLLTNNISIRSEQSRMDRVAEFRLRTYMANGTTPAELRAKADAHWAEFEKQRNKGMF